VAENYNVAMAHTLFNQILVWLAGEQRRWQEPVIAQAEGDIFELIDQLEPRFPSFEERQLENYLKESNQEVEFLKLHRFLYLRPIEEGGSFLPIMAVKCHWDENNLEVRIRMGLFRLFETELKASGFRYETPEGEGDHNYYHAQLIFGFDKDTKRLQFCERWLPVTQPAFCLDANNPVSLLVGLLVSLYGFGIIRQMLSLSFGRMLEPYLEEMQWHKRNFKKPQG
jgi:hypothetical protein